MKTTAQIIVAIALIAFPSCTYVEPAGPTGVTSATRDTTTTATDLTTGESVTTRKRTTHYPAE